MYPEHSRLLSIVAAQRRAQPKHPKPLPPDLMLMCDESVEFSTLMIDAFELDASESLGICLGCILATSSKR